MLLFGRFDLVSIVSVLVPIVLARQSYSTFSDCNFFRTFSVGFSVIAVACHT